MEEVKATQSKKKVKESQGNTVSKKSQRSASVKDWRIQTDTSFEQRSHGQSVAL